MYKACKNSIVKLELVSDTKNNEERNYVVDPSHAKFRCNKAMVVSIINPITGKEMDHDKSVYSPNFVYKKNEVAFCSRYDTDINIVCTKGIHYFKTEEAALSWFYSQNDNNFLDGKCKEWHENGQKKCEGLYKDGKRDGKWTEWYDNEQTKSEKSYKDGKRDGKWTEWYMNGHKQSEKSYKDGKHDMKYIRWYFNGHKEFERSYKNGKEDGKWIKWYNNGQKVLEQSYKDGKKDGYWTHWEYDGKENCGGLYRDGFEGKRWTKWDKDFHGNNN